MIFLWFSKFVYFIGVFDKNRIFRKNIAEIPWPTSGCRSLLLLQIWKKWLEIGQNLQQSNLWRQERKQTFLWLHRLCWMKKIEIERNKIFGCIWKKSFYSFLFLREKNYILKYWKDLFWQWLNFSIDSNAFF